MVGLKYSPAIDQPKHSFNPVVNYMCMCEGSFTKEMAMILSHHKQTHMIPTYLLGYSDQTKISNSPWADEQDSKYI